METTGFNVPHREPVVSRDGSLIAVCSDAQSVAVWQPSTQTRLAHLPISTVRLKAMTFSDNAHFLATGDYDKSICVWDARTGAQLASSGSGTRWLNLVRKADVSRGFGRRTADRRER